MFGRNKWDIDGDSGSSFGYRGGLFDGGSGEGAKMFLIACVFIMVIGVVIYQLWDGWGDDKVRGCKVDDSFLFSGNERHDPSVKFEWEERREDCDKDGCDTYWVTKHKIMYSDPDLDNVNFYCDHGYVPPAKKRKSSSKNYGNSIVNAKAQ